MKHQSTLFITSFFIGSLFIISCGNSDVKTSSTTNDTTATKVDTAVAVIAPPVEIKQALGIDVSHFQGAVNWEEIKANNISFAYAKATQGNSYIDPKFQQNWREMETADVARGAYHFYSTESGGKAQAQHFINAIKVINKGDMPPVLDLEHGGIVGTVDVASFQQEVIYWLTAVEAKFGVKPIIYTNNPFANEYLNNKYFAQYTLWIAEYGVAEAKTPLAWAEKGWAIWQRTERGNIEGEIGNVDHDITKIALEELVVR